MYSRQLLFFFNDTATTEIYTLSLHDALPICWPSCSVRDPRQTSRSSATCASCPICWPSASGRMRRRKTTRSEEHTSELQSQSNLVCRLLLEKKKKTERVLIGIMRMSHSLYR